MKRSDRIKPLVQLACQEQKVKVRALSDNQRKLQAAEVRLSQMEDYRLEYRKKLNEEARHGVMAGRLIHVNNFLNQLDKVITQQKQIVRNIHDQVEISREGWLRANARFQSLQKAMAAYSQKELKLEQKQEQAKVDELFQQQRMNGQTQADKKDG